MFSPSHCRLTKPSWCRRARCLEAFAWVRPASSTSSPTERSPSRKAFSSRTRAGSASALKRSATSNVNSSDIFAFAIRSLPWADDDRPEPKTVRRGRYDRAKPSVAGSSLQTHREQPGNPRRPRILSSGHRLVKLDCSRLNPTKAVKANHAGCTHQPNASVANTNTPAKRRINFSSHMIDRLQWSEEMFDRKDRDMQPLAGCRAGREGPQGAFQFDDTFVGHDGEQHRCLARPGPCALNPTGRTATARMVDFGEGVHLVLVEDRRDALRVGTGVQQHEQFHRVSPAIRGRRKSQYSNGTTIMVSSVATTAPPMSARASPWKIGSSTITSPPMTTAAAVSAMGRKRTDPASIRASRSERPRACASSMKSTSRIEFRTMMPASAIIPIMDVAVKNAPVAACTGRMPIKVNGIGAMITSGVANDWNQPTTST